MRITSTIELPPDSCSYEITLQILKCSKCSFAGIGVYEETRRGGLDSENFYHYCHYFDGYNLAKMDKLIRKCPNPKKSGCQCRIHRYLCCVNEFGIRNWLEKIQHKEKIKTSNNVIYTLIFVVLGWGLKINLKTVWALTGQNVEKVVLKHEIFYMRI